MEQRLRENQTLLQLVTDALPVLISYVDAEHRYRYVNQTYTEWFGWRSEEIVGKHIREIIGEAPYEKVLPAIRRVLSGEKFSFEQLMPYKSAGARFVEVNYVPDFADSGQVKGFYALIQDITARKQAEEDQKFLLKIAETIRGSEDAAELISAVTREIGKHLGVSRSLFMEIDLDGDAGIIHPDFHAETLGSLAGRIPISRFSPASIEIMRAGQTLVNDDIENNPRTAQYYENGYKPLGMEAFVGVPLTREGRWVAALAVVQGEPRGWTEKEISLLESVAERTWLAVEKLRINDALRESEERFRYVADAAPVLIWISDTTKKCIWFNEPWLKFTGRTMEEEYGDGWAEGVHPDDFERCVGTYHSSFDARQPFSMEYRLRRSDSEYRWMIDNGAPSFAPNGDFVGYIGSCVDITEHKQSQEMLERYRLLSEKARDVIWLLRPDGSIVEVNQAAVETYGYSREELLQMNVRDLREKSTVHEVEAHLNKALGDGGGVQFETVHVRRDGTDFPVEINANAATFGGERFVMSIIRDISERRQADEKLRKSEAEFRQLADAVPQFVWVTDAGGRIEYVNRQWTEFSGLDAEETRDRDRLASIFHPDDQANLFGEWKAALESGTLLEVEARMRNQRTNEYRWFLIRSVPFQDGSGKAAHWFGTSTDITVHKKAESRMALLAEISELTRRFEDTSDLLFAISRAVGEHLEIRRCLFNEIDLENDRETVHRDYCRGVESVAGVHRISDYSPVTSAEMRAGKTIVNHDSKNDPRTADNYEAVYEPNGERAYVAVPLMRQGQWVASLWVSDDNPRRWSAAEVSLLETIAERTWSVIEKLRIDAALRESEQRFATAFNSSPLVITITSLKTGKLLEVNESFVRLTGFSRAEAVGRTTAELGLWSNPPDRDEEISAILRDGQVRDVEYVFRLRNGEQLVGLVSAELLELGSEACALTVVQDITARKRAEMELERLLEREQDLRRQADNANRLKDEFLATVSHELRTPLNAILGWATMVRQSGYDSGLMSRAFEVIERNARNQNQIISDILDVSRIITGKLNLNLQRLELPPIIEAAVDTVRPAIEAKRIRLAMRLDPNLEMITGDPDRLQQIVWNLLSNAVKFTPEEGSVEISLRRSGDSAEILVSDNGGGIEPEFLPFVFDRFRQADGKTDRRHGGLGLGLSIVRHLVEMHGGSVSVESEGAGKGATFTVRLPLRTVAEKNNSAALENELKSAGRSREMPARMLDGLKILVVDDEKDALELASFILSGQGGKVFAAGSADEALEIFDRENLDVLVSDIGMPGKDGYGLIREIGIRTSARNRPFPTIALTAYARAEDNRKILQAGYHAYLPKPVEPTALVEKIVELIAQNR